MPAVTVSQGFFEIFLAGPPTLGRTLTDADQDPGAPAVAPISHELWRSFGGKDAAIVGRSITIDGVPTEVIGVLPPYFDVPSIRTGVWLPERIDPQRVVLGGFGQLRGPTIAARHRTRAGAADLEGGGPQPIPPFKESRRNPQR